jgi:hypothetical protein
MFFRNLIFLHSCSLSIVDLDFDATALVEALDLQSRAHLAKRGTEHELPGVGKGPSPIHSQHCNQANTTGARFSMRTHMSSK